MNTKSFWFCVALGATSACQFNASCNGARTLNIDKAKEFISTSLASDVGQPPKQVTCPASVKIEKGASLSCTADFGSATATVVLVQKDDAGFVTIAKVTGILIATKLEATIAEHLGKKLNAHFSVACGARIRPSTAGDRFTCTATDAAGAGGTIAVTVKDTEGNVHFEPVATPPP